MRIRSITPTYFGPFAKATRILLDPQVTILTGPNDSGKSSVLSAIRMFFRQEKGTENHMNSDRIGTHTGRWEEDPEVQIEAELEVTEESLSDKSFRGALQVGEIVTLRHLLNISTGGLAVTHIQRGQSFLNRSDVGIRRIPRVVELTVDSNVRSAIPLAAMTHGEHQLLKLAFGSSFTPESIQSLTLSRRGMQLQKAEEKLNDRLRDFFPAGMIYRFRLLDIAGQGKEIGVSLLDDVSGYTPVELRGSGIKRLLSLMGMILQEANPAENCLILLDEPETALHADAQHALRTALEALGRNPRLQVVYATHSPSMVNSARPERLRVFSRHYLDGLATTTVETPSYGDNFQKVRVSLGLTPSDSLLYGLVTILVEGDTEARCLGPLLARLASEGKVGFEGLDHLLESCHFISCGGDSIAFYCKLADGQNGKPLVFLDGDKQNIVTKLQREVPEVPIVQLPERSEFENLVPSSYYIAAVAQELQSHGIEVSRVTLESFNAWWDSSNLPRQMMFSKRVDRWLSEVTGSSFNKHKVMDLALKLTPAEEIIKDTLLELARTIKSQLKTG